MHDFTVIVLTGAYGSSVAAAIDMLGGAAGIAPRANCAPPRWRVASLHGGPVRLQSGLEVPTRRLALRARTDASTWIIPGLALDDENAVLAGMRRDDVKALANALPAHLARGGRVAACCSAVFVLAAAGVLDGRRVTTSWWLAPLLRRLAPLARMDADRMVCADGPVVTGGAAFAQTDLMLHLLRGHCGGAVTDLLARYLLVDAREAQSRYMVPEVLANGDALVSRIVDRIERALPYPPTVSTLAAEFCVSERTLSRRIRRTTGKSTMALVQSVRLRRARVLLEQSRMSLEQIAEAVGYSDPGALRRLIRSVTGASPSQFRAGTTPL